MKNLCSGTQCGGFQFLLILDLWVIRFHAVEAFGLGKNLLFKSVLGHCGGLAIMEITIRKPFETFRRENEYTQHGRRKQSYNK